MTRYAARGIWLVVAWVALWENLSAANILGGLGLAVVLLAVFPPEPRPPLVVRPLAALRFAAYFAWKLVEASVTVAWEVATPWSRINEGIVAVPLRNTSPGLTSLVANAISLTPGTLTLEVRTEPTTLYVHVLHLRDIDVLRREVRHLEALAIRAFGASEAVGQLDRDPDPPSRGRLSRSTTAAVEGR